MGKGLSHTQREWQELGRGERRGPAYERGVPEFWSAMGQGFAAGSRGTLKELGESGCGGDGSG